MRVSTLVRAPTLLVPCHALSTRTEQRLFEESLTVRLSELRMSNKLLFVPMPGDGPRPLLCDRVTVSTSLLALSCAGEDAERRAAGAAGGDDEGGVRGGGERSGGERGGGERGGGERGVRVESLRRGHSDLLSKPAALEVTMTKSIERPSERTPAVLMRTHLDELALDGALPQYELLWRTFIENTSRRGRLSAGMLGVWGPLARSRKVRVSRVQVDRVDARIRRGGRGECADELLAAVHVAGAESRIESSHLLELVRFAPKQLRVMLAMPPAVPPAHGEPIRGAPTAPRELLEVLDWTFELLTTESYSAERAASERGLASRLGKQLRAAAPLRLHLSLRALESIHRSAEAFARCAPLIELVRTPCCEVELGAAARLLESAMSVQLEALELQLELSPEEPAAGGGGRIGYAQ